MKKTGLLEALLKFKVAFQIAPSQECRVRTFMGVFEVQKTADGRAVDFQSYLEYAQNADMIQIIESRWHRAEGRAENVAKQNNDLDVLPILEKFHRTVTDIICKFAGKVRMTHKL